MNTYVARIRLKAQSVGVRHMLDMGTVGTQLPACPKVSSKKIIIFYTEYGRDTFQTRSWHNNVKIEEKRRRKFAKLATSKPQRLSNLPSYLSCVAGCSLMYNPIPLFFFFFLTHMLAAWDGIIHEWCGMGLHMSGVG
jgi:hypothetical protein